MEGLAKGVELVWKWLLAEGPDHGIGRVWFFADNTVALSRIYAGNPGRVHDCTIRFRVAAHDILDANPYLMINIEWVPAHRRILGNEMADGLAKFASLFTAIHMSKTTPTLTANRREVRDTAESSTSGKIEEVESPVLSSLNAHAVPNITLDHASQPLPMDERTPELPATLEKPAVLSPPLSPAVRQYELGQIWQDPVGQASTSIIIPTEDAPDELSEVGFEADSVDDSDSDTEHVFGYASDPDSEYDSD